MVPRIDVVAADVRFGSMLLKKDFGGVPKQY
jgi:hypothetical protein